VIALLHDVEGREPAARGGGIAFEAVVGTDDDQVAVAPGALRRTWMEGGRRHFHYSTDAPIGGEWAFLSADYAVHEGRWRDVPIRNFHHPKHTAHLDRTMRGVRASPDYYTEQFGPYPYHHLAVVEIPGAPGPGCMPTDPHHVLEREEREDNVARVETERPASANRKSSR
jgi:ABC-2 type transport system permease protein